MIKACLQLIVLVALFLTVWFSLSRINFIDGLEIERLTKENEEKISTLLLDVIRKNEDEVRNDSINQVVDRILERICIENGIRPESVTMHVIDNTEVNALALPGRHMIVFTGLVAFCKTPDELAGVIAHELSHMEKDHVMKKLIKEVGLTMLVVIAGGNGGGEILTEVFRTLSSKAFDRGQETEADMHAVKLLSNAELQPKGLSDFLFRLSQTRNDMPGELVLLSTHPGSAERAAEIISEAGKYKTKLVALPIEPAWRAVKRNED